MSAAYESGFSPCEPSGSSPARICS